MAEKKYISIIEKLEKCLSNFQKDRGQRKSRPGASWLSDERWGAALTLIGDYAGNRRLVDIDIGDIYIDKSKLAKYRRQMPVPSGSAMPQIKVHALVRGIARMYGFLSPTPETIVAGNELCKLFDIEFAPGGMAFAITDRKNVKQKILQISFLDLLRITNDSGAIAEYCKFGIPTSGCLSLLFRTEVDSALFWTAFKDSISTHIGGLNLSPFGIYRSALDDGHISFRRTFEPNWKMRYGDTPSYISGLTEWFYEWRTLVLKTQNLFALGAQLRDFQEYVNDLSDDPDQKDVHWMIGKLLESTIYEFDKHRDAVQKNEIRTNGIVIEDTIPSKKFREDEVDAIAGYFAHLQKFNHFYNSYDCWRTTPIKHVLHFTNTRQADGFFDRIGFAKASLPYWPPL